MTSAAFHRTRLHRRWLLLQLRPLLLLLLLCIGDAIAPRSHGAATSRPESSRTRPNILWIIVDDMSPNLGCYGERTIQTPNLDALAERGTRFSRAFVTAPVCSPCRSALITGRYQTSIGAHHHRSGRGTVRITLPPPVEPLPARMQRAGYYTSICTWPVPPDPAHRGKTDYNFDWKPSMYQGSDWSGRREGQPFFAQIQLHGGKNRAGAGPSVSARQVLRTLTPPAAVKLPPQYPDDPLIRADWAAYLDACRYVDKQVGEILERLEEERLLETTLVFFMTDHGISHARSKQFLYDEGTHVAFIAAGPGIPKGKLRGDLVEANIDITATSLAFAGEPVPPWMDGRDLFSRGYQPRTAVFAARDRCDETVDGIRSVRTERWKYIRNFYPDRPLLQPNAYKDAKPIVRRIRELHEQKRLTPLQERLLFSPTRAEEELYDLDNDPLETRNLAASPRQRETLTRLRTTLDTWMRTTGDQGRFPESWAAYESDQAATPAEAGRRDTARDATLEANIQLMKRWAIEKPMRVRVDPPAR